ncbi:hypothetical protein B5G52_18845 [Pseudoalteromonas sp. A601]|nr:hypothetical protein B5G52_18845 [Pseudoalteromonas sp. A601]
MLGTPKAVTAGKLIYDWYIKHGCTATIIVICNSLQKQLIKDILKAPPLFLLILNNLHNG